MLSSVSTIAMYASCTHPVKPLDKKCSCGVQIAMHLSDYMKRKRLGDQEVADAIGVSRPTISRIRRGIVTPSFGTMTALFNFSDRAVKPQDFMHQPKRNGHS